MFESPHSLPETGPIILPVQLPAGWEQKLDTASRQISGVSLMPPGVAEPEYILRGNKLRCPDCGTTRKTSAKYIEHYRRSHNGR